MRMSKQDSSYVTLFMRESKCFEELIAGMSKLYCMPICK